MRQHHGHRPRLSYFSPYTFWGCMVLIVVVFSFLFLTRPAAAEGIDITCRQAPSVLGVAAIECHDPNRPAVERVPVPYTDGTVRVVNQSTYELVECIKRVCATAKTKEHVGNILIDQSLYATLNRGYYLFQTEGDYVRAWPIGQGPAYGETVSKSPTPGTYDLWCDPQSDSCYYEDQTYTREQLVKVIPRANVRSEEGSGWWCAQEVCYNQADEVIGLNPFYYLYQ